MCSGKLNGRQLFSKLGNPGRILAPMVDQSELAWRILSRRYGATLTYTPMLHAKLFATSEKYRRDMWGSLDGDESVDRPLVVQICGNDPEYILKTAQLVESRCDAVDLNLGCPQGIAKKGHYGSFLMEEWDLISKIISTLHEKLTVPVTAKIRVFPDREKTLKYAQMIVDSGAQILTVHGRLREQKGQKTGLADWDVIKYVRENLKGDVVLFANGNVLYPEDVERCMAAIGCDGVMSAEGNLYNPGVFNSGDKDKTFPRVDKLLREYFEIVREVSEESRASCKAMKSHVFKILRPFLPHHIDLRASIAEMNAGATLEEWESKVVAPLEERMREVYVAEEDSIGTGPVEPWGGSYKSVPYWRCQPYFRPVNGVTGDQRVREQLNGTSAVLNGANASSKKRKSEENDDGAARNAKEAKV